MGEASRLFHASPGKMPAHPNDRSVKMNKAKVIGLVALMSVSSFAMAAYTGPQEQNKVSVAQLKDVADDQWVTQIGRAHV